MRSLFHICPSTFGRVAETLKSSFECTGLNILYILVRSVSVRYDLDVEFADFTVRPFTTTWPMIGLCPAVNCPGPVVAFLLQICYQHPPLRRG